MDATICQLTGLTSLYVRKCLASWGSMGTVGTLTQLRALDLSDSNIHSLEYISGEHPHNLKFDQSNLLFVVASWGVLLS